jgi:hypothetical protein
VFGRTEPVVLAPARRWQAVLAAAFIGLTSLAFVHRLVALPGWVDRGLALVRPFGTFNAYGAFAVMTKSRAEIIVEATQDGVTWAPYEFPWKPGALERRPQFVAPLQPRLDWQMWFASLSTCQGSPWVLSLQRALLRDVPEVTALFGRLPFAGRPLAVRTRRFEYRFAPLDTPGVWWVATERGPFCPPLALGPDESLVRF